MALLIPPPAFTHCTTNLSGTPANNNQNGTAITSGTSNGVGSTTAIISAITHDVELLEILISGTTLAANAGRVMLDVFTDPAGGTSWGSSAIIPNLICGGAAGISSSATVGMRFLFPIWIKSGSSIGGRFRCTHATGVTARVIMTAWGGHSRPSQWWCGQTVYDIGTTTASTSGVSHTAGTSGAYSSWTNFGSTTTAAAGAVVWGLQTQLAAHTALGYYFEFGVGSTRIGNPIACTTNTNEILTISTDLRTHWASIPSGTQFQVRATCSATAEALDVAAYIIS